jgi:predicted GNAT family acetyltransferase
MAVLTFLLCRCPPLAAFAPALFRIAARRNCGFETPWGTVADTSVVAETANLVVSDNPAELRYELRLGDLIVGEIRYRLEPGIVVLVHTEVSPASEGQGLGARLVAGALDDIRARGLRVVPICPFVLVYIRRHPEYADLIGRDPATPE